MSHSIPFDPSIKLSTYQWLSKKVKRLQLFHDLVGQVLCRIRDKGLAPVSQVSLEFQLQELAKGREEGFQGLLHSYFPQ
jgi:hypothetical protein